MKISKDTYHRNLRTHAAYEVVFNEGDPGTSMYVILSGRVDIRKRGDENTTRTLISLKQGDFFGEMAIIDKKPRTATAIVTSNCRLLLVDEIVFDELIRKNPDFALKMIRTLSLRLRHTDRILEEMMSLDIQKRILVGVVKYLSGQGNISNKKDITFSMTSFCNWATRHLGMTTSLSTMTLDSLVNRNLIHKVDSSSGDMMQISKNIMSMVLKEY